MVRRSLKGVVINSRTRHALAALIILLIEIAIARWMHDDLIRPYVGDSLAVVLVYAVLRAATRLGRVGAVASALLLACLIECGQWFGLVDLLGLGRHRLARIVIGTGFDPRDFIAYAIGAAAVLLFSSTTGRCRKRPE